MTPHFGRISHKRGHESKGQYFTKIIQKKRVTLLDLQKSFDVRLDISILILPQAPHLLCRALNKIPSIYIFGCSLSINMTMSAFLASPLPLRPIHQRHYIHTPRCNADGNTTEASAMAAAAATFILKRASQTYLQGGNRPPATTVMKSLLQIEKLQKQNNVKCDEKLLYGQWRVIFAGNPSSKAPFSTSYFPLNAQQIMSKDDGGIFDNGIKLGPFYMRLRGAMRWATPGNRMEFGVDRVTLGVGDWKWSKDGLDKEGYSLEGRTAKELPFLAFCLLRQDLAVARGRGGGMALYSRVPKEEEISV